MVGNVERTGGDLPGSPGGTVSRHRTALFGGLLGLLALATPGAAVAQGNCEVNNQASCTVTNAAFTITLTVSRAARLTMPSTTAALPTPSALAGDGAGGVALNFSPTVQSNTPWSLSISASSATWSGVPVSARQDKPSTDLEWSLNGSTGWNALTTVSASLYSAQPATNAAAFPLYLRVRYWFILDTPGSYTLPVQVLFTAP